MTNTLRVSLGKRQTVALPEMKTDCRFVEAGFIKAMEVGVEVAV